MYSELKKIFNNNLVRCIIISLLIGFVLFLYFFGNYTLNPEKTIWIFACPPDLAQSFFGWHFFRNASWDFPLGLYDTLSYPLKISVYNTLSIPLFAMFFKLLSPVLPNDFQYFGIWVALCFMLQSMFGMLLIKKFTKNNFTGNLIGILSGILFTLSPVMILQSFWHVSNTAHWLILLCFIPIIYHYQLSQNQKAIIYAIIGFLASTINPYTVVLCGMIVLSYSIYCITASKKLYGLKYLAYYSLVSIIFLYITGIFSQNTIITAEDLFNNSFNLNGFFNSMDKCRFFHLKNTAVHQTEGFTYFGIGIIFLISISLISFIKKQGKHIKDFYLKYKKEITVIVSLIVICFVLAISPRVTLGNKILFEIPYPDYIIQIWNALRCTARFIWIPYYIILILTFISLAKNMSGKIILPVLIVSIFLQLYDLDQMRLRFSYSAVQYSQPPYLTEQKAQKIISPKNNIKHIYVDKDIYNYAQTNGGEYLYSIANLIKNTDITLNYFYYARELKNADTILINELQTPKDGDLFVFSVYDDFLNKTKNNANNLYVYSYQGYIYASVSPISGWEIFKINN